MPVEIRELVIKTSLVSEQGKREAPDLTALRRSVVNECLRELRQQTESKHRR